VSPVGRSAVGDLTALHDNWEALANADPLWAALTDPELVGGAWNPDDFLASGEREIATVLDRVGPVDFDTAGLDFGCGAGRLTQALARRFREAHGVDISEAMIQTARQLDADGRCVFHLNRSESLDLFPDDYFGLVYTSIVLQHMRREYQTGYIREFLRVTRPGGLVVFQIPDREIKRRGRAQARTVVTALTGAMRRKLALGTRIRQRTLRVARAEPVGVMEMHPFPEGEVRELVERAGGAVRDVALTNSVALDFNGNLRYLAEPPSAGWVSKQFTVVVR
jgi:SAM-dependent methyltransferase